MRTRALRVALASAPAVLATVPSIVLMLAPSAFAQGPSLAEAARAFEEGRFAEAGRAYADALAEPGHEPAELLQIHLRLGIIAALGGDDPAIHFAIALALDPVLDPPVELSPELRARFEALREAREGRRLSVRIEEHEARRTVSVHDAPGGLVVALRVRGAGGYERRVPWAGAPIELSAPPPFWIEALDAHGGVLARAGDWQSTLSPAAAAATAQRTPPEATPAPPAREPSLIESPWLWIAVAIVVTGVAVAIAFSASGDRWTLGAPILR